MYRYDRIQSENLPRIHACALTPFDNHPPVPLGGLVVSQMTLDNAMQYGHAKYLETAYHDDLVFVVQAVHPCAQEWIIQRISPGSLLTENPPNRRKTVSLPGCAVKPKKDRAVGVVPGAESSVHSRSCPKSQRSDFELMTPAKVPATTSRFSLVCSLSLELSRLPEVPPKSNRLPDGPGERTRRSVRLHHLIMQQCILRETGSPGARLCP